MPETIPSKREHRLPGAPETDLPPHKASRSSLKSDNPEAACTHVAGLGLSSESFLFKSGLSVDAEYHKFRRDKVFFKVGHARHSKVCDHLPKRQLTGFVGKIIDMFWI
jgi:hypothetical protein